MSAVDDTRVTVLLVDDQPAKLLSYEVILAELGENLIKAGSPHEALGILLKTDVAVVLIDVVMPQIDGFQLAAMIREHPRFQKLAMIFVSGVQIAETDHLRGYEIGAVDYVAVPVVPEVLRAKVKVFVELYQMQQRTRLMAEERVALAHAEAARKSAEEATRRSTFLSRASRELGATLDLDEAMQVLLRLAVPRFAWNVPRAPPCRTVPRTRLPASRPENTSGPGAPGSLKVKRLPAIVTGTDWSPAWPAPRATAARGP